MSHDLCKESLRFAVASKCHVSSREAVGDQIRTELFCSFSQEKGKTLMTNSRKLLLFPLNMCKMFILEKQTDLENLSFTGASLSENE